MIQGLPENLRAKREEKKLTRKTVCDSIGISEGVLCEYEQGNRTPSLGVLMKLCSFYNCSPNDLLQKDSQRLIIDTSGLSERQIEILNNLILLVTEKEHG